jgi:hypothetical protein
MMAVMPFLYLPVGTLIGPNWGTFRRLASYTPLNDQEQQTHGCLVITDQAIRFPIGMLDHSLIKQMDHLLGKTLNC